MGCGWLGQPLARYFIAQGKAVRGSTTTPRKMDGLRSDGVQPFHMVANPELSGAEVEAFFDCDVFVLNIPPERRADIVDYHGAQVRSIARAVARSRCRFVVYVSSTSVYPNLNRVVTEADTAWPEKESGKALREAEAFLMAHADFECVIVRLAGLIGPGRSPGQFLAGKRGIRNGDAPVNLIHRDDAVGIIAEIVGRDIRGEVFNGVADRHPLRREYYLSAAMAIGLDPPTFDDSEATTWKVVDGGKLKRELGYCYVYPDPSACLDES